MSRVGQALPQYVFRAENDLSGDRLPSPGCGPIARGSSKPYLYAFSGQSFMDLSYSYTTAADTSFEQPSGEKVCKTSTGWAGNWGDNRFAGE